MIDAVKNVITLNINHYQPNPAQLNPWTDPNHDQLWLSSPKSADVSVFSVLDLRSIGDSWRRSIVVRTLVSAGELSLSCPSLLAGRVTTLWLSRPLSVSQHCQLSHPSLRGR